jgi:hypothetical protein
VVAPQAGGGRGVRPLKASPETPAPGGDQGGKPSPAATPKNPEAPIFDPASLPSLDSIGAQTDISAFLKPGVPSDLKLAALRRAWTMDPAIRDFKGLQENDWNFNDPNGIPGFGELDPGFDVKKMLGDLFGESPRIDEAPTEIPSSAEQLPPQPQHSQAPVAPSDVGSAAQTSDVAENSSSDSDADQSLVQRDKNIAVQSDGENQSAAHNKKRRSQGSALPE